MKFEKREAVFLLCYIICIITMYVFGDIYNKPRALWLAFSLLTIAVYATIAVRSKLPRKNLVFRSIVILLFTIAAIASNKPQMMIYAALICTADLTSFRRIVTTCFFTCIITIVLVFIADIIGVVPERAFRRGTIRAHAFGFGYYNVVPFTLFFLVLEFFYIKAVRHKKASWLELIIIFGINYIIYRLSTLRLAFYLICIALAMYIILVKFQWIKLYTKPKTILCTLAFPILFIISLWVNYSYTETNEMMVRINRLLSDRLEFGHQALEKYAIRLFGQQIQTVNSRTELFYLDSGFLFSLLGYGLLFTGMALVFYMFLCRRAAIMNNKPLFIWLFTVAIFSIINNTWISLYMNPILLYVPIQIRDGTFEKNRMIHDLLIQLKIKG